MIYDIHNQLILRSPRNTFEILNCDKAVNEKLIEKGFLESIYLASPSLAEIAVNDDNKTSPALLSVLKYLIRSCHRCTPFGLFSGLSLVKWGEQTDICFTGEKRITTLDMEYLYELSRYVSTHPSLIDHLKFKPNNSIYKKGHTLRYFEFTIVSGKRHYFLNAVVLSTLLEDAIKNAANGITIPDLASKISSSNLSLEEAIEFILLLINNQILLFEYDPAFFNKNHLWNSLNQISNDTSSNAECDTITKILTACQDRFNHIDSQLVNDISEYKKVLNGLNEIGVRYEENKMFHVDLYKKTETNTLDKSIKNTLNKTLEVLLKLASPPENKNLEQFKLTFHDRYGDKDVPLLEALDGESGIGYPSSIEAGPTPLTENLSRTDTSTETIAITKTRKWLFKRLQKALLNNEYNITIQENELTDFTPNWDQLPSTFSIFFRVTNFTTNEIYIENAGGSSAIQPIARFVDGIPEMNEVISDIANTEIKNNPHSIFAEIRHVPENRLGNIVSRSTFYDYEIPYISISSSADNKIIEPQDLYLSIKSEHIKLFSRKLNKEVIPRLSNYHNYTLSELPVYRFLADLQNQNKIDNLTFEWGPVSKDFYFLPRVTCRNCILHLATWQLPKAEWQHLLVQEEECLISAMTAFTKKWKISRYAVLVNYDQELFVDFENRLLVKAWISAIKSKETIVLKEYLFDQQSPIQDEQSAKFTNQFVASAIRKTTNDKIEIPSQTRSRVFKGRRTFVPGTEWIYFKYYCSSKSADKILMDAIRPIASKLLKAKLIHRWFFVRYKDTHNHLRIRFNLSNEQSFSEVINIINQSTRKFISDGTIWRVQMDTYEREVERYGINRIEQSEQMFFHDSTTIVTFLHTIRNDHEKDKIRWLWGIKAIDQFLNDFKLPLEDKLSVLNIVRDNFSREYNLDKYSRLEVDRKFRTFRKDIERCIEEQSQSKIHKIIDSKSEQIESSISDILKSKEKISKSELYEFLHSHIHLLLNRLLVHSHRLQELVIYDFMYRYYNSARIKAK